MTEPMPNPVTTPPESVESPHFSSIALIGAGMIGASLAKSIRYTGLAKRIQVLERDAARVAEVVAEGFADFATTEPAEAVQGAELVLLCTNVAAYAGLVRRLAPHLAAQAIVSDVGSVKASVLKEVPPLLPDPCRFVAAHPIAGMEKSGPTAGIERLFERRWCILTPTKETAPDALARVDAFWRALGAQVTQMDAEAHDRVLAITSHLPHLIAYSIVDTAAQLETSLQRDIIQYSASGFRDFTRIAGSDPLMWRDIFMANGEAVLDVLQRFQEDLIGLQRAIRQKDAKLLETTFRRTRRIRKAIIEEGQAGQFEPREPEITAQSPTVKPTAPEAD